jgi:hypothetical protein
MLHKDYYRKSSVGKTISGHESQGAWRQGELIGGSHQAYSNSESLKFILERSVVEGSQKFFRKSIQPGSLNHMRSVTKQRLVNIR